ncbi:MAG: DUF134 domain-containing protein [Tissierellia bacterium]|nr:DUF134 domain-containing protein [Tissierellia bacterium]MDD4726816.1 DUF134 domain-containing protein [Tissierellia bacterium]
MVRPVKWRKICQMPISSGFRPLSDDLIPKDIVKMAVDEYETVRLIDFEGLKQEECAKRMNVARTTVQSIYYDARKKIAESLVQNKILVIEGGNYELCDGRSLLCDHKYCMLKNTNENNSKEIRKLEYQVKSVT